MKVFLPLRRKNAGAPAGRRHAGNRFNSKNKLVMDKLDLTKYGISGVKEVVYNPSYDELFREETKKGLKGFEKGQLTDMGAVNVMTGVYTGRSPKDKFFVMDETTKDTIWWTSDEYKNDNKPVSKEAWQELKKIASKELSGKKLYVEIGRASCRERVCLYV